MLFGPFEEISSIQRTFVCCIIYTLHKISELSYALWYKMWLFDTRTQVLRRPVRMDVFMIDNLLM